MGRREGGWVEMWERDSEQGEGVEQGRSEGDMRCNCDTHYTLSLMPL